MKITKSVLTLIFFLLIAAEINSLVLSDDWIRYLKVVSTSDPTLYGLATFHFSDNILIAFACNVYECSYKKTGF